MPLVPLSQVLSGRRETNTTSEKIQVVVYTNKERSYGLVVDRILDIVEDTVVVQGRRGSHGVLGTAVIQEKVTELLDLEGVIRLVETETDNHSPSTAPSVAA
jgi:two-component system chemotaxis sensor kinase CheA